MSDHDDPSLLSYPVLPPSTLEDTPSQLSLIDFNSPQLSSSGGFSFPHSTTTERTRPVTPTPPIVESLHNQHSALHSVYNPPTQGVRMSTDPLKLKVQHLEQLCGKLQKEKSETQEEFGKQRKKFMDKLVEVESERTLLANTIERYNTEIREISTQLMAKDEEVNNVRVVAKMSTKQAREDFDVDRVKYEEEIASLRQIMTVQSQDQSAAFSQERDGWKRDRDGLLAEIQRLKSFPAPQYTQSPTNLALRQNETTPIRHTPSQSPDAENLDFDMAKAAMDVKVLRSVVVPLEEEIDVLKVELSEAKEQLARYKTQATPIDATPPLIEFDTPATTLSSTENDPVTQLQAQLTLERSARQDLEMHTEALVAQKTLTHQEILMLTQDMGKYKDKYKTESDQHNALKNEYTALKKTWELANQHFMVAQDRLKQEIYNLSEQVERLTAANRKESVHSSSSEETRSGAGLGGGVGVDDERVKSLTIPRLHKRSQSSMGEENPIPPGPGPLQRRMSSSLPTLEQLSGRLSPEAGGGGGLETRLTALQDENKKLCSELDRQNKACRSYESQLQRVQNQMLEELDGKERDIDRLRAETEKLKAGIMRERDTQKKLRRSMQEDVNQIGAKMETFRETDKKVRQEVRRRKDNFTELKHDTQLEIARLTEDKRESYRQLESAREEYDCLKVLQSQQMLDYQHSFSKEKAARKEAETSVKAIKSHLSAAQARLQSTEEDLCSQLTLVKEQLQIETRQKQSLTSELTSQLASSMRENDGLQSLKVDIEAERRAKNDAVSSKLSIQEKSTAFIQQQQREIEKLHAEKESKDKHVVELTRQVSLLKNQLDRTAETQKDFVELSQSLQMRIVEMEESQQSNSSDSVVS
ncbi:rab GTPase-binding effector protein 1-like [Halichondria panicea]|uniref:rab GTPase-binding effector protein 1-like n=1 Tax=Halichondria panicea TaxID=6063 RepID=UPI00312B9637